MGKGSDKITGFPRRWVAARRPLRSHGEDGSGHTGGAGLAEWRLVADGGHLPPQGVIPTEHRASMAAPGGSEVGDSRRPQSTLTLTPVHPGLLVM